MDDNGLIIEQRAIKQQYNGDAETYKRVMAEKRKQVFSWNDIYTGSVTLPEYEGLALRFITSQLGDVPRQLTLADEPFIRHAIYEYEHGHGNFDKLCAECEPHINNINSKIEM